MAQRKDQQTAIRSKLARLRVERGLYQHELAQAIGISVDSLRRFENGNVSTAPLWWYANAAIALGLDLAELLTEEQLTWHPQPQTPEPPDESWLAERVERAAAWLAETESWPTGRYGEDGAIY
jgi:transcriptional regulator with XRE-family HTH domain